MEEDQSPWEVVSFDVADPAPRIDRETRRTLERFAGAIGIFVVLVIGLGVCSVLTMTPPDPVGERVASVKDVQEAGVLAVPTPRIFLLDDGEILALSWRSPHLGDRMSFCESAQVFYSPAHGETFDRRGIYMSGPAPGDMTTFEVTVRNDDVFVDLSRPIPGALRTARGRRDALAPSGPFCSDQPRW